VFFSGNPCSGYSTESRRLSQSIIVIALGGLPYRTNGLNASDKHEYLAESPLPLAPKLGTIALIMSTLCIVDPFATALFPSASRRAVLGLLYGTADRAYYLREIVDATGLAMGQIQRELERLSQAGIIRRTEQGRHVYFQADDGCPIFDELRGLVTKTVGAAAILKRALSPMRHKIVIAMIYGSVARGEENAQSDLDLLIIGHVTFAEVVSAVHMAESELRREINPTVYPVDEFRSKVNDGNHFLTRVIQQKNVFLQGDENELGKLLE
jgi:predicted nucleotidyltransferase